MARIGSGPAIPASFALDHARFSAVMILIAAILAGIGLARLDFEDGHESVFASSTAEYARYQAFAERYSGSNTNLGVLVGSDAEFTKQDISALQDLVLEIQLVEGVEAVFSLFSLQKADPDYGGYLPVFGEFEEARTIAPLLRRAIGQSFSGMQLISGDLTQTVVVTSLAPRMTKLENATAALAEIDEIARTAAANSGLTIEVTGLIPIRNWVVEQIRVDQPVINALGALFGFFVSLFIFRNFWIALLNGVAPVFALTLSLGLLGLCGFPVNVLNTALPVLVLVLASSDCTHITYEFCRQTASGHEPKQAIRTALTEMISPCALTSLTTIVAFATLHFSPSPLIRELGIAGALCVCAAFLAVLLVHPLVFLVASRFESFAAALRSPLPVAARGASMTAFFNGLIARRRWIVASGLALGGILAFMMFPIQTSYSFSENIRSDNPLVKTQSELEAFSGPMTTLEIPLAAKADRGSLSADEIAEIAKIHRALEERFPAYPIVSLDTIARFIESEGNKATPGAITELMELLPETYRNRIASTEGDGFLVSMMVPDLGSERLRRLTREVEAVLGSMQTGHFDIRPLTGILALSAQLSDQMIRQLMISFLSVALLCPVLIGLWFRSLKFVWMAFLPNLLPILAIGAWMMLDGRNVQFTSALAMTIAFGIAVDDTIHVFNRLSLGAGKGFGARNNDTSPQAVAAAMAHVSPALVTTTLILASGLIVVLWSEMPMIEYFGLLCVATFLLALIADIVLLPAMAATGFAVPEKRGATG